MNNLTLTFTATDTCLLRTFLFEHHISKKSLIKIKQEGDILVNGVSKTVRYVLQPLDVVTLILPLEIASTTLIPSNVPIDVLYEDDYICAVSKPVHVNSMPSQLHPHDSLVERVLYYLNGKRVPHIISRLDRDTSGIVLFAKHGLIHHFMTGIIHKEYIAVATGQVPSIGIIEAPIARMDDSIIKRHVHPSGKYALTRYKVIHSNARYSLVNIELPTGRTHQIRVHFSFIGHPLVGDTLYGLNNELPHQALHACFNQFIHPITNEQINIYNEPTKEFYNFVPMV